jgi:pyroglutamyl-peptidase
MKLLVTGFEPFGGATENPSQELLGVLEGKVATLLLPNAIRRAPAILLRAVMRERPDTVLHLGESRESKDIIVERGAVNLLDTNIPDNDGNSAHDEAVVEGEPAFLGATVPVEKIERAIRAAGIPVRQRSNGGTHVSNQVFYRLLDSGKVPRVGYIHIPPIQHRPRGPGMPFWKLLLAVTTAIDVLGGRRLDRVSGAR